MRWTDEDDNYLLEFYHGMGAWHMARDLGKTKGAIYNRIATLKRLGKWNPKNLHKWLGGSGNKQAPSG